MWWTFINADENCKVFFHKNSNLEMCIEENLYILWELSPVSNNWVEKFREKNSAQFEYCDETFNVTIDRITHTVVVENMNIHTGELKDWTVA